MNTSRGLTSVTAIPLALFLLSTRMVETGNLPGALTAYYKFGESLHLKSYLLCVNDIIAEILYQLFWESFSLNTMGHISE